MCACPRSSYAVSCQLAVSCSVLVPSGAEVSYSSLRERASARRHRSLVWLLTYCTQKVKSTLRIDLALCRDLFRSGLGRVVSWNSVIPSSCFVPGSSVEKKHWKKSSGEQIAVTFYFCTVFMADGKTMLFTEKAWARNHVRVSFFF